MFTQPDAVPNRNKGGTVPPPEKPSEGASDDPTGAKRAIDVSPEDLQALTPDALRELQQKHGLELSIRSSARGIDKILETLGREEIGNIAVFDRGFDRTSPGYDKYYNRDRNDEIAKIFDPAINPGQVERGPGG